MNRACHQAGQGETGVSELIGIVDANPASGSSLRKYQPCAPAGLDPRLRADRTRPAQDATSATSLETETKARVVGREDTSGRRHRPAGPIGKNTPLPPRGGGGGGACRHGCPRAAQILLRAWIRLRDSSFHLRRCVITHQSNADCALPTPGRFRMGVPRKIHRAQKAGRAQARQVSHHCSLAGRACEPLCGRLAWRSSRSSLPAVARFLSGDCRQRLANPRGQLRLG